MPTRTTSGCKSSERSVTLALKELGKRASYSTATTAKDAITHLDYAPTKPYRDGIETTCSQLQMKEMKTTLSVATLALEETVVAGVEHPEEEDGVEDSVVVMHAASVAL